MKKYIFILSFLIFLFASFAQNNQIIPHIITEEEQKLNETYNSYKDEVPDQLKGIWQGSDRLVLFGADDSAFACVLRVFYQWYDDRAAEPARYAQISTRDRNDTTAKNAENIEIKFKTLCENNSKTAGAWELQVKYPGLKEYVYIPVSVINGNLYLGYFLRQNFYREKIINTITGEELSEIPDENSGLPYEIQNELIPEKYYLVDTGTSSGITISPPVFKKELLSYFVDGTSIYHLRFWLSDMEQTDEMAQFSDGEKYYEVKKYIKTSGRLFTCTTGRSSRIRNIQKSSSLPVDFTVDHELTVYASGKPYLTYVPGSGTREKLQQLADENNKRRHPPLKPLFPVSDINFHWKEISELEKYNPYTWNRRNLDIHK